MEERCITDVLTAYAHRHPLSYLYCPYHMPAAILGGQHMRVSTFKTSRGSKAIKQQERKRTLFLCRAGAGARLRGTMLAQPASAKHRTQKAVAALVPTMCAWLGSRTKQASDAQQASACTCVAGARFCGTSRWRLASLPQHCTLGVAPGTRPHTCTRAAIWRGSGYLVGTVSSA